MNEFYIKMKYSEEIERILAPIYYKYKENYYLHELYEEKL